MGGWGSGRGQSGRDTTSDYRALDVRRLQRDGLLTPGRSFGWNWTRDGETVASIQVSSRVGTATSWPMPASGKPRTIVQRDEQTGSGTGLAGKRAS